MRRLHFFLIQEPYRMYSIAVIWKCGNHGIMQLLI